MKENENTSDNRKPGIDIPSESNRDKHVNYLQEENTESQQKAGNTNRQQEWKQGLKEGEEARREGADPSNREQDTKPGTVDETLGIP